MKLSTLVIKLLLNLQIDVHWSRYDDVDGVSWIKRFIAAIEKCRLRAPPSAFRARTSHAALSNIPPGSEKNWLNQLIQIPGIEFEAAQAIAHRFPSPKDLIEFFYQSESIMDARNEIANIEVTRTSGTRKLSMALASRLHQLFEPNANPCEWVFREAQ